MRRAVDREFRRDREFRIFMRGVICGAIGMALGEAIARVIA